VIQCLLMSEKVQSRESNRGPPSRPIALEPFLLFFGSQSSHSAMHASYWCKKGAVV